MKKTIATILFLLVCSTNSAAQEGAYIAAKAGTSFMSFDSGKWTSELLGNVTHQYHRSDEDTVFAVGGAIGYDFTCPVRAELEYMFRPDFQFEQTPTRDGRYDITQKLNIHTLLLNLFYDFENSSAFTPFILAGGGIAILDGDNTVENIAGPFNYDGTAVTRTHFAWNIGGGITYSLSENIALDLTARYLDLGKARWENESPGNDKGVAKADMSTTECLLGVRYTF